MRVMAAAGDAGGGRCLLPVIDLLRQDPNVTVECRAYGPSVGIWGAAGLDVLPMPEARPRGFDRLLCASSMGPRALEVELLQAARAAAVGSIGVLDFWSHYRERFIAVDGSLVLPDVFAVMDERARGEMIACGFPAEALRVTGQPAFDALGSYLDPALRDRARHRVRTLAGAGEGHAVVLYASQPLAALYRRETLGFVEAEVLDLLVPALARVLDRRRRDGVLLVKPHPRDGELAVPVSPSPRLRVQLLPRADDDEPRLLALGSDLVTGMSSTLLLEACFLRQPVLSLQPGLRLPDPLPSNHEGWSRAVYDAAALEGALDDELFDVAARTARAALLARVPTPGDAARKVRDLVMAGRA
jgi:hypothetical protein